MEIRELRAFLEVAREENMTRAAGNLHMSQPSLSPGRSRFCANRPRICGITWKAASLRRCLSISIRARSISPCSRRTPI